MTIQEAKILVKSQHPKACLRKASHFRPSYAIENHPYGIDIGPVAISKNEAWRQCGLRLARLSEKCIGN
jgi:hypothetical protein